MIKVTAPAIHINGAFYSKRNIVKLIDLTPIQHNYLVAYVGSILANNPDIYTTIAADGFVQINLQELEIFIHEILKQAITEYNQRAVYP